MISSLSFLVLTNFPTARMVQELCIAEAQQRSSRVDEDHHLQQVSSPVGCCCRCRCFLLLCSLELAKLLHILVLNILLLAHWHICGRHHK